MSQLQRSTLTCIPTNSKPTFLSCQPVLMRRELHNKNIVIPSPMQEGDYNSKENCIPKMAINKEIGVCSKNNFGPISDRSVLCNTNNTDHDGILPLCNQIKKKQPLSDNIKNSNWVRVEEKEYNKNIFSNNKKEKPDVNSNIRRRRIKLLVNQTPLRQIYKTNRRRSELLDMLDLKVLHSSLGRIFVTLSALAFVTFAAGSPSFETSGK